MNIKNKILRLRNLFYLSQIYFKAKKIIWDLDGTLYFNPSLINALRINYINYYKRHLKKSGNSFLDMEKSGKDWIDILGVCSGSHAKKIIIHIEKNIKKHEFVQENKKLVNYLINNSKQNYIFTNSGKKEAHQILDRIGTKNYNDVFTKIITIDDMKEPKPFMGSYKFLLKHVGRVPHDNVIYIGDSIAQDIYPAKSMGFCTIFVNNWGRPNIGDVNYTDINTMINDLQIFEALNKSKVINKFIFYLSKIFQQN